MKLIVAICGASGVGYGIELLKALFQKIQTKKPFINTQLLLHQIKFLIQTLGLRTNNPKKLMQQHIAG